MRILFLADLHYSLKQFDWLVAHLGEYDLGVIGGDLLDMGSGLDADVQIAIVERYLGILRQKTRLVVSSGNHDGDSRNEADESTALWLREAAAERLHVDGDSFDLGDTRITVCPWWDGEVSRSEVNALLERSDPGGRSLWIWVYHAPPQGARTSWAGKRFIGDDALRGWIDRFRPDIVLSGHIHNSPFYAEGSWHDRIGSTWVFNPGRQIGPEPSTITLDLRAMTAEWHSLEGRSIVDLRIPQS